MPSLQVLGAAARYLHVLGRQALSYGMGYLGEVRFLVLSSGMTVWVRTCQTRAVSRSPLAGIAMSTLGSYTAGD